MDNCALMKTLEIAAPLISAVGGGFLSYDAFRAPVKSFERWVGKSDFFLEDVIHRHNLLPLRSPPYSPEERDRLIAEEMKRHESARRDIQNKHSQKEIVESHELFNRTAWGFLLITAGCLLQTVVGILR